jgi:hypothetical protein
MLCQHISLQRITLTEYARVEWVLGLNTNPTHICSEHDVVPEWFHF